MLEPFCTLYRKDYRNYEREPEIESAKPCLYYNDLVENFLPLEDSKAIYNAERDEAVIKEKCLKSLMSTYQSSYCSNITKKSLVIDPDNLDDDAFIVHFNQYYAKKTQPVPRPLDTARRINGYSRFDYYYTRKSELEETINRSAYEYFKRDYDRGKNRLYGKKQKAMYQKKQNTLEGKPEVPEKSKPEEKPKVPEKPKPEEKPEVPEEPKPENARKRSSLQANEKICGLCCEKFGDFTIPKEN